MNDAPLYPLGTTGIRVTPIGLGCWQFSRSQGLAGSYWPSIPQDQVVEIVRVSLEGGINWFDTAEVYGNGASEKSLAAALHSLGVSRDRYRVADKWFPAFRFARSILKTFPERERALDGISIDLHQIHQPFSFSSIESQIAGMAALQRQGRIGAVGVSNFNAEQMRRAQDRVLRDGLSLASNQMRYSLLDREIERNGVLEGAAEMGITIIAYSPLAQGILSGKFHPDPSSPDAPVAGPRGPRRWFRRFKPEGLAATEPLIRELRRVAETHGASPAQIALAWATQYHGERIVAIPGASSARQAAANAATLGIVLSREDMDLLADAGTEAEKKLKKLT